MAKKGSHGGRREGAGRPPKKHGKTVTIAVTVPEELAKAAKAFAKSEESSLSRVVTVALSGLLKRQGRG